MSNDERKTHLSDSFQLQDILQNDMPDMHNECLQKEADWASNFDICTEHQIKSLLTADH